MSRLLLILLLTGSKVIELTIPALLQIARHGVNSRPMCITFDMDQTVIHSSVNGVLVNHSRNMMCKAD